MQFRDMFQMDLHPSNRSDPGQMSSLRSQVMETEAFQDLMEQSVLDRSTDGGSDSGENSLGGSERRGHFMEGVMGFSCGEGSSILFSRSQTEHDDDSISSGHYVVGAGDDIKMIC